MINYYSRIADILLPHLAGRAVTFIHFPDGVGGQQFFEKNVPRGAPDWLPTVRLSSTGSRSGRSDGVIEYALLDELAALVWAANMAALELHVPQWQVNADGRRLPPDRLVFDLDPGPGASIVHCCRVAERLRDLLLDDGLTPFGKTSGSKGMLNRSNYCPLWPCLWKGHCAQADLARLPDLSSERGLIAARRHPPVGRAPVPPVDRPGCEGKLAPPRVGGGPGFPTRRDSPPRLSKSSVPGCDEQPGRKVANLPRKDRMIFSNSRPDVRPRSSISTAAE
ncbi:hypothetical protein [Amycolatopsis sp. DG1A-15b]|uniref:non-homologous end-joining DNA ligase LigD n=1 Tax=Amycolatopsis sp. DG1A-15b TaxID=3052846 RepID=UPI00255B9ED4|nr:hypothetical protein [Amycolatopsis sp. DG1A-15b]WIX85721.1 hypothetical protein QRY02_31510 [Amycolatopsis sp. DG1A-15b]